MVSKWLVRLVRGQIRTVVTLTVLPLAVMNGLPFAAGCICADGHYEPVCQADLCHAGKGNCGCSSCAHHSCCNGATACCRQRAAQLKDNAAAMQIAGKPCCTPVVHEAVPTVVDSPQLIDVHPSAALIVAVIELPSSVAIAATGHRIEFGTARPPDDLVITLRRLVI